MIDSTKVKEETNEEVTPWVEDEREAYRIALPFFQFKEEAGDQSWRKDSLCLLYPSLDFYDGSKVNKPKLRAICEECPVTEECLQYALVAEENWGFWGGKDENERKAIKTGQVKVRVRYGGK